MIFTDAGKELLKHLESRNGIPDLNSYLDETGRVWTIGYGHTGAEVHQGVCWTLEQCENQLWADLMPREKAVAQAVKVLLSDNQFSAIVIFVYNVGISAFCMSTLLHYINLKYFNLIPQEIEKWNKITDKSGVHLPSKGLTIRRRAEINLWSRQ